VSVTADQRAEVQQLRERVSQLETALLSRVAIEQAKGILMERFGLSPEQAFELLRRAARNNGQRVNTLAALVTAQRTTPPEIEAARRNGTRGKTKDVNWGATGAPTPSGVSRRPTAPRMRSSDRAAERDLRLEQPVDLHPRAVGETRGPQ
jgi:hypothetical protein